MVAKEQGTAVYWMVDHILAVFIIICVPEVRLGRWGRFARKDIEPTRGQSRQTKKSRRKTKRLAVQ